MQLFSKSLILISIIIGLMLESKVTLSVPPESPIRDTITGSWLGELEIPNTSKLRMGLLFQKPRKFI